MKYTEATLVKMLSKQSQPPVPWYAKLLGFFTTPLKFLGISGWVNTDNYGTGSGILTHDAAHSTDGFYTVDVELQVLFIDGCLIYTPENRFIRLEIEPKTKAHDNAALFADGLKKGAKVSFGGKIYIDNDGPFLEIHPTNDFLLVR